MLQLLVSGIIGLIGRPPLKLVGILAEVEIEYANVDKETAH